MLSFKSTSSGHCGSPPVLSTSDFVPALGAGDPRDGGFMSNFAHTRTRATAGVK